VLSVAVVVEAMRKTCDEIFGTPSFCKNASVYVPGSQALFVTAGHSIPL